MSDIELVKCPECGAPCKFHDRLHADLSPGYVYEKPALAYSVTADVHRIPDNRCPMCVGILANAIDEGADGTPVESANDYLEHGGHFFGCSKYRAIGGCIEAGQDHQH